MEQVSQIIKDGLEGDICLIGFCDEYCIRNIKINKSSQSYGPDCIRRFIKSYFYGGVLNNNEFDIDLSKIIIYDYGNCYVYKDQQQNMEDLSYNKQLENFNKFINKIKLLYCKLTIPLVFGATRDVFQGITEAFTEKSHGNHIIQMCKSLDLEGTINSYDYHQQSIGKYIINKFTDIKMTQFGIDSSKQYVTDTNIDLVNNNKNINIIFQKDLKLKESLKHVYINEKINIITNVGIKYYNLIKNISNSQDISNILVYINLDVISSCFAPGVATNTNRGFNVEEIMEIMIINGLFKKIKCIAITEFCTTIEDFITGHLVAQMIYQYFIGFASKTN